MPIIDWLARLRKRFRRAQGVGHALVVAQGGLQFGGAQIDLVLQHDRGLEQAEMECWRPLLRSAFSISASMIF